MRIERCCEAAGLRLLGNTECRVAFIKLWGKERSRMYNHPSSLSRDFLPWWLSGKESTCQRRRHVQSLGREDPLEKGMTAHSSILAWEISWTEEPGGLQSMGSQRGGHELVPK